MDFTFRCPCGERLKAHGCAGLVELARGRPERAVAHQERALELVLRHRPASAPRTIGYLVADAKGRVVGTVEAPMYGTKPDIPDAISVRSGFLSRRRRLVPADAISEIDSRSGVVGLSVDRDAVLSFL